ncbi:MAG: DUF3592 domain-containing protein [Bacteroidia bacterium]
MTLNRSKILFIGTAISFLIALINRLDISYHSTVTDGLVTKIEQRGRNRYYPLVQFKASDKNVTFYAEENLDVHPGDPVQVIYNTHDPEKAWLYSLGGFWITPFFWCVAPFMILAAFLFSYLHAGDIILVNFSRNLKLQLIRDPKVLRKEQKELDDKEAIRRQSLKALKRRK